MKYEPAGPPRFAHQRRGLAKMLATNGITALLFDPGLGKTAVVLDYVSLLALKSPRREARVLVVAPLAAVDTWVIQALTFVSMQVNLWVEALGGTLPQRAEALASRGGQPFRYTPVRGPGDSWQGPRAAYYHLALANGVRGSPGLPEPSSIEGPDGLGTDRPRVLIEVINIDTFSSRARWKSGTMADLMVNAVKRYNPDLVVVDESHKIKSVTGNASRLMARLASFVRRRVLLTGTVMPHSPMDVFAQWRFLDPYAFGTRESDGALKQATFGSFRDRFAVMGGWMGKEIKSFKNLDEMQAILSANSVVAKKEDSIDLPPTTEVVVPVPLGPEERSAYRDMAESLATVLRSGDRVVAKNFLARMMRLRQITSGFVPDDHGRVHEVGHAKADIVNSIVHDNLAGEHRVVVFALFRHEIALLARTLSRPDTEVMIITGDTPAEERAMMRKRFGSSDPGRIVMIAQIKTMSLSVNELVTASNAVFASLSQQRDDLIQAKDRLDRIGQTKPVTFWYALAPGSVDEVIFQSHRDRTDLEAAMLDHIRTYDHDRDL